MERTAPVVECGMPSRRVVLGLVVLMLLGCGSKSASPEIRRDVHAESTWTTGLPGERVAKLADARPALTITGISGAVADGVRTRLSGSGLAKHGALTLAIEGVPAEPARDGKLDVAITATGVFAHPPQVTRLAGTIKGSLSYNGIGANALGVELGDIVDDWLADQKLPADLGLPAGPVAAAKEVAVGSPSCSLHVDGTVRCWHESSAGVPIPAITGTKAIAAGNNFGACGIRADGRAYCIDAWGEGSKLEVRAVCGIEGATAISVGQQSACAIVGEGRVRCWGGAERWFAPCDPARSAVEVKGVTGAFALDTGAFAGCAITADGGTACWELCGKDCKSGVTGQVDSPPTAHGIDGIAKATQIVAGHDVCAATGDHVVCASTEEKPNEQPTDTLVPEPVKELAWSWSGVCARGEGGKLFCWSKGGKPEAVPGIAGVVEFDADLSGSCAITAKGVLCWGGPGSSSQPALVDLSY